VHKALSSIPGTAKKKKKGTPLEIKGTTTEVLKFGGQTE
jgi:hypothetical protein